MDISSSSASEVGIVASPSRSGDFRDLFALDGELLGLDGEGRKPPPLPLLPLLLAFGLSGSTVSFRFLLLGVTIASNGLLARFSSSFDNFRTYGLNNFRQMSSVGIASGFILTLLVSKQQLCPPLPGWGADARRSSPCDMQGILVCQPSLSLCTV